MSDVRQEHAEDRLQWTQKPDDAVNTDAKSRTETDMATEEAQSSEDSATTKGVDIVHTTESAVRPISGDDYSILETIRKYNEEVTIKG